MANKTTTLTLGGHFLRQPVGGSACVTEYHGLADADTAVDIGQVV